MNRNILYPIIMFAVIISSCKPKQSAVVTETKPTAVESPKEEIPPYMKERLMSNFEYLKSCMNGFFTSEEQSKKDSSYFNIHLTMTPIWKSSENVFFLYVEQAMSTTPMEPYRVRIYKVVRENDNAFTSYIYTLPDEKLFIGKKAGDPIFNTISQEDIIEKQGCEVKLVFDPVTQSFNGGTGESTCASDRNGAKWATSKVMISEDKMVSWDQGWDEKGQQVWGARKGGYVFIKQK